MRRLRAPRTGAALFALDLGLLAGFWPVLLAALDEGPWWALLREPGLAPYPVLQVVLLYALGLYRRDAILGTRGAIVYLRARRPAEAAPPREQVREELASQLLVGLQRRAMDELAGKIRREVGVLVMDRALGWSWDRRADAAGGVGGADQPPGR